MNQCDISAASCSTAVSLVMTVCGGSAPTPARQSQPTVLPLTITRTGGLAGFRDVLVVAGDDPVPVTLKGQKPRRYQLTPAAVERLTTAVSRVPWSRVTSAHATLLPHDMVTTVQAPAGGPVRLEDPKAGRGDQVIPRAAQRLPRQLGCLPHVHARLTRRRPPAPGPEQAVWWALNREIQVCRPVSA